MPGRRITDHGNMGAWRGDVDVAVNAGYRLYYRIEAQDAGKLPSSGSQICVSWTSN